MTAYKLSRLFGIFGFLFFLTACQTIDPAIVEHNIAVHIPGKRNWFPEEGPLQLKENQQVPLVFFLQGTGGGDKRALRWASWFKKQGIGSVIISSAKMRGRSNLNAVPLHAPDVQAAMQVIKNKSNIDLSHYAIMGFSKGGTAALKASTYIDDEIPEPDFIFALYPGLNGQCGNSGSDMTITHVFYGELDQWGIYDGNRNACKRMTNGRDNAFFHLLENAHHGYDDRWHGKWKCCGRSFLSSPNEAAMDKTKEIILTVIKEKWPVADTEN